MIDKNLNPSKVLILGGGSFQGKSLVSLEIAHIFKIPIVICTDTIRNVLHSLYPDKTFLSTSTYLITPENLEKQFHEVSRIINKMLDIWEKRGEDVIIEGVHLSKDFIQFLSGKHNVLLMCLNNTLTLRKRLEYKSLTRSRVEYNDPATKETTYGPIITKDLSLTPYMKHAKRIDEIHSQIVNTFSELKLPIIRFSEIDRAIKDVKDLVENFISSL